MAEHQKHSVASSLVGLAFASACAARLLAPGGDRRDLLSWSGLVISVTVSIAMAEIPEFRGLLQRAMFAFSFVFVVGEVLRPPLNDVGTEP